MAANIYIKRQNYYRMCGTCNIIRYELNKLPEIPEYNRGYGYYKYYIDHEKVREILAKEGTPMNPLPFAGAVYIIETGENLYYEQGKLRFSILNRKLLSQSICNEFGLYAIREALRRLG